jgi:hypothetical protein
VSSSGSSRSELRWVFQLSLQQALLFSCQEVWQPGVLQRPDNRGLVFAVLPV